MSTTTRPLKFMGYEPKKNKRVKRCDQVQPYEQKIMLNDLSTDPSTHETTAPPVEKERLVPHSSNTGHHHVFVHNAKPTKITWSSGLRIANKTDQQLTESSIQKTEKKSRVVRHSISIRELLN